MAADDATGHDRSGVLLPTGSLGVLEAELP
jgi:hypothetical protein